MVPEWVQLFNDANFVVPFHLSFGIVTDVTDVTLSPFATTVLRHKRFYGTLGSPLAVLMRYPTAVAPLSPLLRPSAGTNAPQLVILPGVICQLANPQDPGQSAFL
jgi:hypothetical protein